MVLGAEIATKTSVNLQYVKVLFLSFVVDDDDDDDYDDRGRFEAEKETVLR